MCIFFRCPFTVYVLNEHFDPEAPFDDVPLCMAHLVFAPPHSSPLSTMESDPSKVSSSSASAALFGGGQVVLELLLGGTRPTGILENNFHILELD